jgi:hypothetical protein
MPYLETPDELADALADLLGVYGAHEDETCTDKRPCRPCFTAGMADRIRRSVANEQLVGPAMEPQPARRSRES